MKVKSRQPAKQQTEMDELLAEFQVQGYPGDGLLLITWFYFNGMENPHQKMNGMENSK